MFYLTQSYGVEEDNACILCEGGQIHVVAGHGWVVAHTPGLGCRDRVRELAACNSTIVSLYITSYIKHFL